MKVFILLCAFVVLAHAKLTFNSPHVSKASWENFKSSNRKSYKNDKVEQKSYNNFAANMKKIKENNKKLKLGQVSFEMAPNKFADLSLEEYIKQTSGLIQPPDDEPTARTLNLEELNVNLRSIPASLNWTALGAVTPVRDQGDCASCWAFSATGALEGQQFLKQKKLIELSDQNLVDCSGIYKTYGCLGGWMANAFKYVQSHGINPLKSYPYTGRDDPCKFDPNNVVFNVSGFVNLPKRNETALKIALATIGPLSVAIDHTHQSFGLYKSGVYYEPACRSNAVSHGVLLTGYGTLNGKDYWIIKNSWGTGWGMNGYMLLARNADNHCAIASWPCYPTV